MKIFIGIKYKKECLELIPEIKKVIELLGHNAYCFATDQVHIEDEKEMMKSAFKKIDESDVVLFESSQDSFGLGIEAGYAFTKGKKIVTIVKDAAALSRTLKGISNYYLTYKDFAELREKLQQVL